MSESRPRDELTAPRVDDSQKPSASEVRAELERILASRCFQQAGRATDFLRFVVEQTLSGNGQRLKGYTIGVEVFGRPADFDAQSDALVRVEAGRLRRRLVEYYASEGASDAVRIDLPRGSYAVDCQFVKPVAAPHPEPREPAISAKRSFPWQRVAVSLAALLVLAVGIIAWQQSALREAGREMDAAREPAPTEWPRIIVVPVENLGAPGVLDVVAASMTEEIMLRLDELDLFVVASRASWYGASHEKPLDVSAAGSYLLTGSVRGTAEAARITVRLIETGSGAQLWTAAYDQPLAIEQLTALQEQVARDVAAIAAPYGPIFEAELARARRLPQEPTLRDCVATHHEYRRKGASETRDAAIACYQSVAERQPDIAEAWSRLALLYVDDYASSFGQTGDEALEKTRVAADRALSIKRDDFHAHLALTRVQYYDGDSAYRDTIERTLALRPNSAQALVQSGFLLTVSGDSEQGLLMLQRALEHSKAVPGLYHLAHAMAYLRERQFSEALASAEQAPTRNWVVAQAVLAAAAAHAGRSDVAAEAAARIRELYPRFESEALTNFERWHFDPALHDVLVTGLEAAGLALRDRTTAVSGG